MKKYSRNSKRTMKRSMRSKKMTRRRRQRGGSSGAMAGSGAVATSNREILINCGITGKGAITVKSSDPSITVVSPSAKTLNIKSTIPIKNIQFGKASTSKIAQGTGIILKANNFIIDSIK